MNEVLRGFWNVHKSMGPHVVGQNFKQQAAHLIENSNSQHYLHTVKRQESRMHSFAWRYWILEIIWFASIMTDFTEKVRRQELNRSSHFYHEQAAVSARTIANTTTTAHWSLRCSGQGRPQPEHFEKQKTTPHTRSAYMPVPREMAQEGP